MERKKEHRESFGEIEAEHPGYLGVGSIKGVERICQQTYSRVAFAKLYEAKHAITALRILTDQGTEDKDETEYLECELYLNIESIEHARTQVRHP